MKDKYIKSLHTYEQILQPLIDELIVLYNDGISINIEGSLIMRLYGALATVSGDNLSAHALAGFRRCFSSGRICRYCIITYDQKEQLLRETKLSLRTEDMHSYHLQALSAGIDTTAYGVERRCPLLNLPYFLVTSSFPADVLHDVLESVIPLTLKCVFNNISRIVTTTQINEELHIFQLGRNDTKNKPVSLPLNLVSGNISGSAPEKLCFLRILSFLIGYRVPADNKFWLLYVDLREIVDHLLSPVISKSVLPYLQILIEGFLKDFVSLFPDKFTPKLHFLLHYAKQMEQYGPLKYLWCMRFEAKHKYFKKLAFVGRNYKNIAKTLAKRHQLRQCWEFASVEYLKTKVQCSGETSIKFKNLTLDQQTLLLSYFHLAVVPDNETLWKCAALTVEENAFKLHDILIADLLTTEEVPLFFKVCQILKF